MSFQKIFTHNRHYSLPTVSLLILTLLNSRIASAGFNDTIENALKFGQDDAKYGQIKFDLRYRFEQDDT